MEHRVAPQLDSSSGQTLPIVGSRTVVVIRTAGLSANIRSEVAAFYVSDRPGT
jgi:hypothetical protein